MLLVLRLPAFSLSFCATVFGIFDGKWLKSRRNKVQKKFEKKFKKSSEKIRKKVWKKAKKVRKSLKIEPNVAVLKTYLKLTTVYK